MPNMKRQPVGYRPFRADPLLSEGLLAVARPGGELEEKVASAMFRMADEFGARADREAERKGALAGEQAALAGRPRVAVEGGGALDTGGKPFKTNDPVATDLPPEARAFLNTIAGGESGGQYNVRFTPRGGVTFSDLSKHPGIMEPGPHGPSSAAGRYQHTLTTWNAQGGGDFSPYNQDHRAWSLAQKDYKARTGRDLLGDLKARGVDNAILSALSPTWHAFNGARGRHAATYRDSLQRFVGQGAMPPPQTAAGTAGVDPAVQAPKVTVSGGGYRPTGQDTIYGRAYDAAGTRTYLQALNAEIESTTEALYDKYRDDPGGLAAAMQDLKADQIKEHVFPEIQAEYELTFDRRSGALVMRAQRDLEKRREAENRAQFLSRTRDLEDARSRQLAGLDPDDAAAVADLQTTQRLLDEHYDAAVDHGILDRDTADRAKRESQRETASGFYLAQAGRMDAEGIEALRATMKADYAAGKLDGIDAEGWERLDRTLERMGREKHTEDNQAARALEERGMAFVRRASAGYEIDQGELGQYLLDAGSAKDGAAIVRQNLELVQVAKRLRDMPIADAERAVRDMRAGLGDKPDDRALATVEAAEAMLSATRRSLVEDPLSHAERMRVVEPTPSVTEIGSAADMAALVSRRVGAAQTAAQHFGVPPRFFKAGETKAIEAMVKADPEQGAALAGAIVEGAGDRAADVLAEFGQAAPLVAGAGAIVAGGGDATAAQDAIAGAGKAPDGRAWSPIAKETRAGAYEGHVGGALALQPDDAARIRTTAENIARKRISEAGIEAKSDEARQILTRAYDEAAGAVWRGDVRYGGFVTLGDGWFARGYRTLVPNTIRADRFGDVLAAIRDEDLARNRVLPVNAEGRQFPAGLLAQMRPVPVAGGYAFARNDPLSADPQFVRGSDGEIYVLDVEGLAGRLAPRVPGAFRGY